MMKLSQINIGSYLREFDLAAFVFMFQIREGYSLGVFACLIVKKYFTLVRQKVRSE